MKELLMIVVVLFIVAGGIYAVKIRGIALHETVTVMTALIAIVVSGFKPPADNVSARQRYLTVVIVLIVGGGLTAISLPEFIWLANEATVNSPKRPAPTPKPSSTPTPKRQGRKQ